MADAQIDNEPMLQLRRLSKLRDLNGLVTLARQHPEDAAELLTRMLSISSRTDRLTPNNYEPEIAALRQALNGRLTQSELDELRALALSRGRLLQQRFGLKGLA